MRLASIIHIRLRRENAHENGRAHETRKRRDVKMGARECSHKFKKSMTCESVKRFPKRPTLHSRRIKRVVHIWAYSAATRLLVAFINGPGTLDTVQVPQYCRAETIRMFRIEIPYGSMIPVPQIYRPSTNALLRALCEFQLRRLRLNAPFSEAINTIYPADSRWEREPRFPTSAQAI